MSLTFKASTEHKIVLLSEALKEMVSRAREGAGIDREHFLRLLMHAKNTIEEIENDVSAFSLNRSWSDEPVER